jgi:hypothetical protein
LITCHDTPPFKSHHHPNSRLAHSRAGKVNFGTTFPADFIDDVNEAIKDLGYSQQQVVDDYIEVLLSGSPDWDDDLTVEALAGVTDFMDTEYRRGKNEKHELALLAYRYHEDNSLTLEEYRAEKKAIQDRLIRERKPLPPVFVKGVVRRFHAASLISGALISFSGLSQTGPAGCQLRILPDQRSGFCAHAFA